jgi:hypothetical protein
MRTNSLRFFVLACVMLGSAVCSASTEDSVSVEALVARARKLHEVWTAGTLPVTMRADIQVFNGKGGVRPGQYIVNWISPTQWREELRFPNYERVRVHNEKGYWQKSGLDFQPKIILQLDSTMLNPKLVLKVRAKQSLGR